MQVLTGFNTQSIFAAEYVAAEAVQFFEIHIPALREL